LKVGDNLGNKSCGLPRYLKLLLFAFPLFILIFGYVLLFYHFDKLLPNDYIKKLVVTFYLVDYNIGICSRFILGALSSALKLKITFTLIGNLSRIVFIILLVFISVLAGKVLYATMVEKNAYCAFVVLAFIFCPYAILCYVHWIGFFDIYMYILTIIAFLVLDKKYFRWLVPLLCVLGVFTHYIFFLTFFPIILALQFNNLSECGKSKRSNIVLFTVTAVSGLFSSVYCIFFANRTLHMNESQFYEYIGSKINFNVVDNVVREYWGTYLFNNYHGSNFNGSIGLIKVLFDHKIIDEGTILPPTFFTAACFLLIFSFFWVMCILKASSKFKKFVYAIFALVPLCDILVMVISVDMDRWISTAIITEFFLLFYCLIKKDTTVMEIFSRRYLVFKVAFIIIFALDAYFCYELISGIMFF
jgi:hypothetical protein